MWVLLGAATGLAFIGIFLIGVGEADPSWPRWWRIRPLVAMPLAGAVGGAVFAMLDPLRQRGSGMRWVANGAGLLLFLIFLWIGTVLGLDGTMWN
jgi:hypothetical protein